MGHYTHRHKHLIPVSAADLIPLMGNLSYAETAPYTPPAMAEAAPQTRVDTCSRMYALCCEWQPRLARHACELMFDVAGGKLPADTYDVLSWCVDEIIGNLVHSWTGAFCKKTLLIQMNHAGGNWMLVVAAKYDSVGIAADLATREIEHATVARMASTIGAGLHVRLFPNGTAFAITFAA